MKGIEIYTKDGKRFGYKISESRAGELTYMLDEEKGLWFSDEDGKHFIPFHTILKVNLCDYPEENN